MLKGSGSGAHGGEESGGESGSHFEFGVLVVMNVEMVVFLEE